MAQKNLLRKKEKGATAAARQSKHAKTSIPDSRGKLASTSKPEKG